MSLGLAILLSVVAVCLVIVLVVVAVQNGDTQRARAAAQKDQDYQRLSEAVTESQQRTAAALAAIEARLSAIERLLREVG